VPATLAESSQGRLAGVSNRPCTPGCLPGFCHSPQCQLFKPAYARRCRGKAQQPGLRRRTTTDHHGRRSGAVRKTPGILGRGLARGNNIGLLRTLMPKPGSGPTVSGFFPAFSLPHKSSGWRLFFEAGAVRSPLVPAQPRPSPPAHTARLLDLTLVGRQRLPVSSINRPSVEGLDQQAQAMAPGCPTGRLFHNGIRRARLGPTAASARVS